jgi:hypothetical protein
LPIHVIYKERRKVPNSNKIKVKKRKSKKVLSFDNTDSHFICIEDGEVSPKYSNCSARDWERSGLLGGIPRVVVQISALL